MEYAFGRVEPKNLEHLRQMSFLRHADRLHKLKVITPPASWDSRQNGWVGSVKDQSSCGSCWDFSGTGVVEIAYNKAGVGGGPNSLILSEEYTLDCGRNGGCSGDDNTTVLDWAKSTGLPLTSTYGPYKQGGSCIYEPSMALYKINDWGFADSSGGQGITPVADIKNAIMTYGCVGAATAANPAFCNNPAGSVFLGGGLGQNNINHDIILIGWDDSKGPHGAWLLRNSWGVSWCDGGYCWISYNVNHVGTEAVFAIVESPTPPPPGPTGPGPIGPTGPGPGPIIAPFGVYTLSIAATPAGPSPVGVTTPSPLVVNFPQPVSSVTISAALNRGLAESLPYGHK